MKTIEKIYLAQLERCETKLQAYALSDKLVLEIINTDPRLLSCNRRHANGYCTWRISIFANEYHFGKELGEYDERPLKEARVKLEKQRKDIDIKSAIIRDNETNIAALREKRATEANPRAQIAVLEGEVATLRAKADGLTTKMADLQPKLTEDERKANEAINAKIIEIERAQPQVAPMPQLVLLPHVTANVEGLQREIDLLKYLPEPVKDATLTAERDRHIAAGNEFAAKAEAAATSEAKCAKCAICTATATCPSFEQLGGTAEEWKEKAAAEYATADELKGIIADKLAMEQDEYAAKMERLSELEQELATIKADEASKNAGIDED